MQKIDLTQFHQTFFEESVEGLDAMEAALLELDLASSDPELVNTIFRAAHSIKGGAATFGFVDVAAFTHIAESLLDEVRAGRRAVTPETVELLLRSVDCLRGMLDRSRKNEIVANADSEALLAALSELAAQRAAPSGDIAPPVANPNQSLGWTIAFKPLPHLMRSGNDPLRMLRELSRLGSLDARVDLDALPTLDEMDPEACYLAWQLRLDGAISRSEIDAVFEWVDGDCELVVAPIAVAAASGATEEAEPAPASAVALPMTPLPHLSAVVPIVARAAAPPSNAPPRGESAPQDASIRVGIEKVDALINMVGELVITQSMLGQLGEQFEVGQLERLRAGLAQLERNTRELQESVMRIRMLPISVVFNRFPRLVRDLSRKLGKQVKLDLLGEATELDKTVLEKIGDPLVHLVRNAIDHGLESPQTRRADGKPEEGTITLDAYHQGGSITVEVRDDGAGLDRVRIVRKALERGLIASGDNLSDHEIDELIFLPGFSTVEAATDLSGRGVGMDVVRRNVNELGGNVEVRSVAGAGTRFTITLPLTLAIIDGLTASVGGECYLVPLVSIVESLQLDKSKINRVGSMGEAFRFRDSFLPLLRLHELFDCKNAVSDVERGIVVVVEGAGRRVGLLVDELLGQQQAVIKSLETHYRRVEGVSGATILGDGSVALIVDVPGLVRLTQRSAAA